MPHNPKEAIAHSPAAMTSNNTAHPTPAPYLFRGQEVRAILDDDGTALFVAADVARVLQYASAKDMARMVRDHHKGSRQVPTPGGPQTMTVLTEPGLFAAIMKSRASLAEQFQDWVTDDVLPSLRRTGTYGQPAARSDDEVLRDAFSILDRRVAALAAEKAALAPRAEAYDAFLDAGDALPMNAVAKALGIGANSLFTQLRDKKVLINGGARHNLPMQRYAHHFKVVAVEYVKPNGTRACSYTTKVRPSGVNFIRHILDLPGDDTAA